MDVKLLIKILKKKFLKAKKSIYLIIVCRAQKHKSIFNKVKKKVKNKKYKIF